MSDHEQLVTRSEALAAAIARRDVTAVRSFLAAGFVQRSAGADGVGADTFLGNIDKIPGEILSITVQQLTVDVAGDGALVTGVQHAQLRVDGELVDDHRPFVDWFVREAGEWRVRAAVDVE